MDHDAFPIYKLATEFMDALPEELDEHIIPSSDPRWGQQRTFDDEAVEFIATEFQALIASVIAMLIDAGSERDAINEDEDLHTALTDVLKEW